MRYWFLTAIVTLTFLIQSVVSNYLAIFGITPDLLQVVVVSYGLLFGWEVGVGAGVLGGLLLDLTSGRFIGLHVLSLGVVGLVAGLVEEKVFKENILLGPTAGFAGSLISQVIVLVCLTLYGWRVPLVESFRYTILPEALYDMVLAALVYSQLYKYYRYLRPDPRGTIVLRRR